MPVHSAVECIHGLAESDDYNVFVNGERIWTEKYNAVSMSWPIFEGPVDIRIVARREISRWDIRPRSRAVTYVADGCELSFTLREPRYLMIEADDIDPLFVLADSPESDVPNADDPDVLYFGPGKHYGGVISLKDKQTLYVAPGAILYASIGGGPRDARICGRGIIDGAPFDRPYKVIALEGAKNVSIEGVTVRGGPTWTTAVRSCEDIRFSDCKIFSFGRNGDGIDVVGSSRVSIDNCILRCTDDCIALKANIDPRFWTHDIVDESMSIENINITRCVMIGWALADGVTAGFEMKGEYVRNVRVRDCDIIYSRGYNRAEGHSAFSIICDGPARVSDFLFEDIRVESDVFKNFELYVTDGQKYVKAPPGSIADVTLRRVCWEAEHPIVLRGHDAEHSVRNVVFDNCTVAGHPLNSVNAPGFDLRSFVSGVTFR